MVDEEDILKPLTEDECVMDHGANFAIDNGYGRNAGLDTNAAGSANCAVRSGSLMKLRIKSSYDDVEVEIPDMGSPRNTSVAQLKALVRTALSKKDTEKEGGSNRGKDKERLEDRYLRLICKGRLLSPDESFLSEFKVVENDVVHAVLGAAVRTESSGTAGGHRRGQRQRAEHPSGTFHHLMQQHQRRRRQRPNRGIGTVVGPGGRVTRGPNHRDIEDGNSSDEENDVERGTLRERRGFDRLRGAGLSRQEITAIRTYFNRHVDRYVEQQQQQQQQQQRAGANNEPGANASATNPPSTLHLDEPDLSRRRLLVEEEWMATQGTASEFRLNLNQNTLSRFAALSASGMIINGANTRGGSSIPRERPGNDRDFVWGFCLGFFVGVISLVWVWMPTIPHKQKLGILAGICLQLMLDTTDSKKF